QPRGEVVLKGKSQPVPVFTVTGVRQMPGTTRGVQGMRSPLVGRAHAWDTLQTALQALQAGRGQIVSLVGEAGLGKSRLAAELHAWTQTSPAVRVRWVEGRCLSYTESVSYRPFLDIVRQLVGVTPGDGEAEAWNKLRSTLQDHLPVAAADAALPFLARFLNLRLPEAWREKVDYLDAEARQRRVFLAIETLLDLVVRVARHPVVLVLEDIHWLDQASAALLEYLMPVVNRLPLMLCLLYRPERAKPCWRAREKAEREFAHCHTVVDLAPLSAPDSSQLLQNLVGQNHWPARVRQLLLARAEGNPLYLEEVLHTLLDDGILAPRPDGGWQLTGDPAAIDVPDTLQGVMMARLDRLTEPARWTIQLAAVIGRLFPYDILALLQPDSPAHLGEHLAMLQQFDIIREKQRTPLLRYIFRHALMQEVCYRSLLARTRRDYHRRISHYLETRQLDPFGAEENLALIAHHAYAGHDWPRALRYQLLAGRQAEALYANHEAVDHYRNALDSARRLSATDTAVSRQEIEMALGRLLTITGEYDAALAHLETAASLATAQQDTAVLAHAYRWRARLHENRGEYADTLRWVQRGLDVLAEAETAESAELRLIAGLTHMRQGDHDAALAQCARALDIAARLDERRALARAHNLRGFIARQRADFMTAFHHCQEAFALYEQVGDLSGQALARNQMANARFSMSQWREADHHYREARRGFEQVGDVYNCAIIDNNLGGIALNQGRLAEALAFYEAGLAALQRIGGSLWALGGFHCNLGATHIRLGDVAAARNHLHTSQTYFDQARARDWLPELQRHLAELALLTGDMGAARREIDAALRLAAELGNRVEAGCGRRVLGEIQLACGEAETAVGTFADSLTILQDVGDEYEWARTQLALARAWLRHGAPDAARQALAAALPVLQRLEAALDLETAHALQAELTA
ncbi:MAG: AAA family ATPase, partial [Anaerolineales bacterium]|nr:AAA family ATPase [Anaerolineales bacterium]